MNEQIRKLMLESDCINLNISNKMERFAELIVQECCVALNPMLRDMISRGQGADLIKKHFGVEE